MTTVEADQQASAVPIEVRDVAFRYGRVQALDGVSFTVPGGAYGLLGPNGAGKTTLLRLMATLLAPDTGSVRVGGCETTRDPDAVRRLIGYLPQNVNLYPQLRLRQHLLYVGRMKAIPARRLRREVDDVLEAVGLTDAAWRPVGALSGGMHQRAGIALALLGRPKVLIVDEPTVGLDPEQRVHFRRLLARLARDATVMLSTHIVDDIEAVCQHVAVLVEGRVRYAGPVQELREEARDRLWEGVVPPEEAARLESHAGVIEEQVVPGGTRLRLLAPEPPGAAFRAVEPTLEDAYIHLLTQAGAGRAPVTGDVAAHPSNDDGGPGDDRPGVERPDGARTD